MRELPTAAIEYVRVPLSDLGDGEQFVSGDGLYRRVGENPRPRRVTVEFIDGEDLFDFGEDEDSIEDWGRDAMVWVARVKPSGPKQPPVADAACDFSGTFGGDHE